MSDVAQSRTAIHVPNGFTFVRIVAAVLVLYTHSYVVLGLGRDPLDTVAGIAFSRIGVDSFFVISGFLLALSLRRNDNLRIFTRNRALRIVPGLAAVVVISVFVVGPLLSNDASYFARATTWRYLLNAFIFPLQPYLPGVFVGQPNEVVNGSLWTLAYEVLCYVALAGLTASGALRTRFLAVAAALLLFAHMRDTFPREQLILAISTLFLNEFAYLFFSGALLASVVHRLPVRWPLTIGACGIVLVGFCQGQSDWHRAFLPYYLLWPYIVISAALLWKRFAFLDKLDISYGVYVYGFVVQQCLVHYVPALRLPLAFAACSILLSCIAGYLSWTLVERPSMTLKRRARPRPEVHPRAA